MVSKIEKALIHAYLDGCHESTTLKCWVKDYLPKIIKKYKLR